MAEFTQDQQTEAYRAAERAIERARTTGSRELDLRGRILPDNALDKKFVRTDMAALARLPPQIATLTDLYSISLDGTNIRDISVLASLTSLQVLSLNKTAVTDLTPLAVLSGLQILALNNTKVSNITPLALLANLYGLSLDQTNVSDLAPLKTLTNLRILSLDQTPVGDFSPLATLSGLHNLWLSGTLVSDLAPLGEMTEMQNLWLNQTEVSDIGALATMHRLKSLWLDDTRVSDITPLAALTSLEALWIARTSVSDLAPLAGLTSLQDLRISSSLVRDLRPIRNLTKLGTGKFEGLVFANTPATRSDPVLRDLSQIDDQKERANKTLAYLATLPPWPAPLPWSPAAQMALQDREPPAAPDADPVPEIEPTPTGIDLAQSPIDDADLANPIKKRLYAKLPEAVAVLARHGNRYVDVKGPTDSLRDLVAVPFEDADLLDIHVQIMALTDLRDLDAFRPTAERMDADCLAALNAFLRLGPPVTMGHPDVDLMEQALADYARQRMPATVPEGERRMAKGLADDPAIAGERLRRAAGQVANAPDQGRMAEYRRSLHRNTVLALAYVAGAIGDAATGFVAGEVTLQAARFLVLHKDAIMATAPAWGQTGWRWLEYMLVRAQQIIDEARGR